MTQSNWVVPKVGSRRLFTSKDLVGFYQVTRHVQRALEKLLSSDNLNDDVVFVSLGRSPAVITEFMFQAYKLKVVDLPLGGMSSGVSSSKLNTPLRNYFAQVLPPEMVKQKRAIVVVDFAYSGKSIRLVRELLTEYVERCCSKQSHAPAVLMVPISWKRDLLDDKHSLLQDFDYETRAAHRLLKTLFIEVDKENYSRYGSVKYSQVVSSSSTPQIATYAQKAEAKALTHAMALALSTLDRNGLKLSESAYLKPRKKIKNRFRYNSLFVGYSPEDEMAWKFNLLSKSASYYGTSIDLGVQARHVLALGRSRVRKFWFTSSMRTRRIIALVVLLLFVWVVYRLLSWTVGRLYD